jgi:hypothetical protein
LHLQSSWFSSRSGRRAGRSPQDSRDRGLDATAFTTCAGHQGIPMGEAQG